MKELDELGDFLYSETGTERWTRQLFLVFDALIDRITKLAEDSSMQAEKILEHDRDIDNLHKRVSNLECPSPMLRDAMNRLHALDGEGDGDINPPDVVTLEERIANLETDLQDARDHYGDAFGEVDVRLRSMRHRLDEGLKRERMARHRQVAQIDKALSAHRFGDEHKGIEERLAALEEWQAGVNLDMDRTEQQFDGHRHDDKGIVCWDTGDPEPDEKPTCGECVHPWRKAPRYDGTRYTLLCYEVDGKDIDVDYNLPEPRTHCESACPNFKKRED